MDLLEPELESQSRGEARGECFGDDLSFFASEGEISPPDERLRK